MKLILSNFLVVMLGFFGFAQNVQFQDYQTQNIFINNSQLKVYIADTETKREFGLSNSTKLSNAEGMLFIFATPSAGTPTRWRS